MLFERLQGWPEKYGHSVADEQRTGHPGVLVGENAR